MAGDQDELESMFDRHHALVFRTAFRITGNAADAEDVLQTVFLRLLRRDAAQAALEKPESYLRRAAIHVALDAIRVGRRGEHIPLAAAPEPVAQRETQELEAGLIEALAGLSTREAEVFALRFFEDQTNKEIAQALGLSQIHVAVILHRARTQIRTELEQSYGRGRS